MSVQSLEECYFCGKVFQNTGVLKSHVEAVHLNSKFKCYECDKEFKWKSSLWLHLKLVHNMIKHQCHICKKQYSKKYDFKHHLASKHKKNISNKCYKCGQKFLSFYNPFHHLYEDFLFRSCQSSQHTGHIQITWTPGLGWGVIHPWKFLCIHGIFFR